MKFSAAILLQIMLVFFTLPVMHNLFTAARQTCATDKCADSCPLKAKQKQNNNNSCGNFCNPFVNCPFCQYIKTESFAFSIFRLPINNVHLTKNENTVFSYNKECWHPPEVI